MWQMCEALRLVRGFAFVRTTQRTLPQPSSDQQHSRRPQCGRVRFAKLQPILLRDR